ncbi:ATP-binding cassette domain-containing protein [Sorangium sp. So ce119]|uniref:ATP-binding cassette domain-containing protein n=1 Tax=Sorangium sp. So ce119 TaxID=3133279 RepID=UPI003F637260
MGRGLHGKGLSEDAARTTANSSAPPFDRLRGGRAAAAPGWSGRPRSMAPRTAALDRWRRWCAVVGICGRSGRGKSMLLRLLLRLDEPSSGAIAVGGVDLRQIPPSGPTWLVQTVGRGEGGALARWQRLRSRRGRSAAPASRTTSRPSRWKLTPVV